MAMAGPFAPVFMNQFDAGVFPRDDAMLAGVTLAGACVVFGLGLLVATQSLFRASYAPGYRAALSVLAFAVIAVHQWTQAPHRGGGLSGAFAREVLNGCPPESVLVTADTEIASMVRAAQHAYGHRPDVTVLPETVLRHAAARQFYRFHQPGFTGLEADYDPQRRMASWRSERPLVSNEFLEAGEHDMGRIEDARGDLIIWDFVRDNFADRPIAFAGVDIDWLHARATVNGLVEIFPIAEAPLTDSIEAWIALKAAGDVQRRDPELAASISRLLLSQSATRRNQNQGEEATRLARLATGLKPSEPRAWRELARAAARNGLQREAKVYSSTFLTFRGHSNDSQRLTAAIDRDARVYDLQVRYQVSLRREPEDGFGWIDRQELASALWQEDEIALLTELLEAELLIGRPSARNYYEAAAAHAQMGDLGRARDHLATAARLSAGDVAERLEEDGRFVLLLHDRAVANESITR
jgi:hypothetical protein